MAALGRPGGVVAVVIGQIHLACTRSATESAHRNAVPRG
jgi:hypothetical protein